MYDLTKTCISLKRLTAMKKVLDGGGVGSAGPRNVSTGFSFRGDASFLRDNIRCKVEGDPLGCLGDLGWYNVGLALWAFDYQLPCRATACIVSQTDEGVPLHITCTLTWPEEAPSDQKLGRQAPRTSTFFCSFLLAEQQWAHISGDSGVLEMEDFVIPFSPKKSSFCVKKHVWGSNALQIENQVQTYETGDHDSQEVKMWKAFASEVAATDDHRHVRRAFWRDVALKTQACMDALLASSRKQGAVVDVTPIPVIVASAGR
mmetsp:Transcript_42696/g.62831  ORF Transcript_42696/g.62831 Transcript_42696/m.62831 type:complete len:260 (+) Transcript_42696:11-790(+)